MKLQRLFFLATLLFLSTRVCNADVMYQCIDERGHKSFSNLKPSAKGSNCVSMDLSASSASSSKPSAQSRTETPANFPKVDQNSQRARDGDRRRILESELESEQKSLDLSKKQLAEQEELRNGDERNYQRVLDRLQPFKDKIALHERNIEAIQREISNLR